jgi:acyl carrier protein
MLTKLQMDILAILEEVTGNVTEEPDYLVDLSLKDIGLDSIDCLDFLYQVKEKFDISLPKEAENLPLSVTINQIVGFLEGKKIS